MNKQDKVAVSPLAAMASVLDGIRSYLRPRPQLPPEAHALAGHFKARGIDVEPRSLRPTKDGLKAVFDLRVSGSPLPILVLLCQDPQAAERFLHDGGDRARAFPKRNGPLVMYLPYWEPEDGLTQPVIDAFASFRGEPD